MEAIVVDALEELLSCCGCAMESQVTALNGGTKWCSIGLFVVGDVAVHKMIFDEFLLVETDPGGGCRRIRLI